MNTKILHSQLNEIGSFIERKDVSNPEISKASVGWHLAHIIKVFSTVCDAMKHSNPANYQKTFNFKKTLVFLMGKIPRGKAKAPKSVLPEEKIEIRELERQLHEAKQKLYTFMELDKNANFPHPYFNQLNKKETQRFLEIHNEHHLKIVRDITKVKMD